MSKVSSPSLTLLGASTRTCSVLCYASTHMLLLHGAVWCQAPKCSRCGEDCRSFLSGRRIHRACNEARIEEQRTCESHVKQEGNAGDAAAHLLANLAAYVCELRTAFCASTQLHRLYAHTQCVRARVRAGVINQSNRRRCRRRGSSNRRFFLHRTQARGLLRHNTATHASHCNRCRQHI